MVNAPAIAGALLLQLLTYGVRARGFKVMLIRDGLRSQQPWVHYAFNRLHFHPLV